MKTWLTHQQHALSASVLRMVRKPISTFFTLLSLAITLSLPAGFATSLSSLQRMANTLPAQGSITVYVHTEANAADLSSLQQHIRALPNLASSRFIGKTQALKDISQQMNTPDLFSDLTDNPLPDAWVLTPNRLDPLITQQWTTQLTQLPMVESVQNELAWVNRLHTLIQLGQRITWSLAILLATGLVVLSGNITRLQISTRVAEIEVSRLIGGTDRFIQRPFLYFGALQGFLAGLIAWGIVCAVLLGIQPELQQLALTETDGLAVPYPSWQQGLQLIAIAASLGWLGAWLAVRDLLLRTDKNQWNF